MRKAKTLRQRLPRRAQHVAWEALPHAKSYFSIKHLLRLRKMSVIAVLLLHTLLHLKIRDLAIIRELFAVTQFIISLEHGTFH